jgi:hypothetical protein
VLAVHIPTGAYPGLDLVDVHRLVASLARLHAESPRQSSAWHPSDPVDRSMIKASKNARQLKNLPAGWRRSRPGHHGGCGLREQGQEGAAAVARTFSAANGQGRHESTSESPSGKKASPSQQLPAPASPLLPATPAPHAADRSSLVDLRLARLAE